MQEIRDGFKFLGLESEAQGNSPRFLNNEEDKFQFGQPQVNDEQNYESAILFERKNPFEMRRHTILNYVS